PPRDGYSCKNSQVPPVATESVQDVIGASPELLVLSGITLSCQSHGEDAHANTKTVSAVPSILSPLTDLRRTGSMGHALFIVWVHDGRRGIVSIPGTACQAINL